MRRAVPQFLAGVGDLLQGFRLWATSPRSMLLGAIPALIVAAALAGALLVLWSNLDGIAAAITPFAVDWADPVRSAVRVLAAAVVVVGSLVLAVLSYTAVVLAVGDPFYERISREAARRLGATEPTGRRESVVRGLLRAAGDGAVLLLASVLVSLLVLALGFVPVVGAALGAVAGAILGGRLLAVELTATPLDTRGFDRRARRRLLRGQRARALGFGVATWVVFLVPFAAIVATPAAVAGATRLALAALDAPARSRGGDHGRAGRCEVPGHRP